jgi:hypothetical protein
MISCCFEGLSDASFLAKADWHENEANSQALQPMIKN